MAFDLTAGGYPHGPCCKACEQLITPEQPTQELAFSPDPHEVNGIYHASCGKPFAELARISNLLSRSWSR
jgi:hypothetical protein